MKKLTTIVFLVVATLCVSVAVEAQEWSGNIKAEVESDDSLEASVRIVINRSFNDRFGMFARVKGQSNGKGQFFFGPTFQVADFLTLGVGPGFVIKTNEKPAAGVMFRAVVKVRGFRALARLRTTRNTTSFKAEVIQDLPMDGWSTGLLLEGGALGPVIERELWGGFEIASAFLWSLDNGAPSMELGLKYKF